MCLSFCMFDVWKKRPGVNMCILGVKKANFGCMRVCVLQKTSLNYKHVVKQCKHDVYIHALLQTNEPDYSVFV